MGDVRLLARRAPSAARRPADLGGDLIRLSAAHPSKERIDERAAGSVPQSKPDADPSVVHRLNDVRLAGLDAESVRCEFLRQGAFVHLPDFLAPEVAAQLVAAASTVEPAINRNYLPGHKQGGSVSRHTLDQLAPFVGQLYRSPALLGWLEKIAGERLQLSPPDDPHAYALYFYTRPGDHIGWHYDTSYYAGRRYTLLLGVLDQSSCRLDYELHTKEPGVPVVAGSLQIPPGGLVFFDGDKLRHRVTPAGANEKRVSLTFEYVTDQRMHPLWRLISNCKDAVAYFGLRQVFRRKGPTPP